MWRRFAINVADAVGFIARAKAEGADFVCFSETYPGPWRMPASFDPTPRTAEAVAKHGINAIYSTIEPLSHNECTTHNLICMAYGDGSAPVSYRRTHPNGPWIYTGGEWWKFQYVPDNEFSRLRHRARQGRPRDAARPTCRR